MLLRLFLSQGGESGWVICCILVLLISWLMLHCLANGVAADELLVLLNVECCVCKEARW